jgi:hypothetical protein
MRVTSGTAVTALQFYEDEDTILAQIIPHMMLLPYTAKQLGVANVRSRQELVGLLRQSRGVFPQLTCVAAYELGYPELRSLTSASPNDPRRKASPPTARLLQRWQIFSALATRIERNVEMWRC